MATSNSLRRITSQARAVRTALGSVSRTFSSDALVEVKPGEVGMVSGIPEEHLRRRVVIYSPARTATQQGSGKVGKWKIKFMSTQKLSRMQTTSSGRDLLYLKIDSITLHIVFCIFFYHNSSCATEAQVFLSLHLYFLSFMTI